jgi:membrane protease YdiL (CAAX protease family)
MSSVAKRSEHRRALVVYFVLAYFFTWLCWIPSMLVALGEGWLLPPPFVNLVSLSFTSGGQAVLFLIFTLGNYGPLMAAVISSLLFGGRSALGELWKGLKRWRVGVYWLLAAVFLPVVLNLVTIAPAVFGGVGFSSSVPLELFFLYLGYQVVTSGFEEFGWRGFALPRLQGSRSAERSSWILGILWGVWHLPYVAFISYALNPWLAVDNMFGTLLSIIGLTFVYTWLFNSTGSILLMVGFHGWWNTLNLFMVSAFNFPLAALLAPVLTWVLAIILLKKYGRENLSRKDRPVI